MLKLIREGSHKYPWILISIMGVIVITFVVGMGWWGFGQAQTDDVATVGELSVSRDEYRRVYEGVSRSYRESGQEDIDTEQVKQVALQSLIGTKVWRVAAEDMGFRISPVELRAEIIKRPEFHRNGKFDPEVYRRLLAANRFTPALFETLERERLLTEKAQAAVLESVALTPSEVTEVEALVAGAPSPGDSSALPVRDMMVRTFLMQKQQRALQAYTQSLKTTIPIDVHRENL